MSVARFAFILALASALVAGCGQGIPPAGNYATVIGRVNDAATGAALSGVIVMVNSVLSATTDANGAFRIVTVPTGPWHYSVQGPPRYSSVSIVDNAPPLTPGETRTLNVSLTHH